MRSDLRHRLVRLGPFLGLLLVVAFFALASGAPERYLSANNLRVVLAQTVIVAIGAIGMTLVIVAGGIDLAVGSTIALTCRTRSGQYLPTEMTLWAFDGGSRVYVLALIRDRSEHRARSRGE